MGSEFDLNAFLLVALPILVVLLVHLVYSLTKKVHQLQDKELRYTAIFQNTDEALFVVENGIVVDCNPKTLDMFRCEKKDVLGRTPGDLSPPYQQDGRETSTAEREYLQAALDGHPQHFNWLHQRIDGEIFDAQISLTAISAGARPVVVGFVKDISAQKKLENALLTIALETGGVFGAEFFTRLVKQIATALDVRYAFVGVMDPDRPGMIRTIAAWNGKTDEDNFSYALAGTPCEQVFNRELCIFDRGVQQQFPADRMLVDMNAESYAGVPLFDSKHQPIGLLVVMDVRPMADHLIIKSILADFATRVGTELDRLKNEKRQLQAAAVFESSDQAIMVTDASNSIVAINSAFSRITGYDESEVQGRNPRILRSDTSTDSRYKSMWRLIDTTGKWEGEVWNKRKNGEEFPCLLRIRAIKGKDGNVENYVGVFSDISDSIKAKQKQRALETQLLQAQKMESIGQLTGGIAHDFNNILSSILGYTDLAMDPLVQKDDAKLKSFLEEVYRSGERAKNLISQMLTFSRANATGDKTPVVLLPEVQDAIKMLRPVLPSSISIDLVSEISEKQAVEADSVQLHQLITNLCINARDAIDQNGHIGIRITDKTLTNQTCSSCHQAFSGKFVDIEIADDGQGISPEVLNKVFEPFFSTKEVGKGTGMGLAMVHGIVHDHDGHILASSVPGQGTRFEILLPVTRSEQDQELGQATLPDSDLNGGRQKILVVDDEHGIANLLKEMLTLYNYDVSMFTDSLEALDHFEANADSYDLVITDQTMPNLVGSEMVSKMLERRPDLPVVLCTGFSDIANNEQLDQLGIRACLQKPIEARKLLQTISAVLTS